jgi:rare lipoprotein A
MKNKIFILLFLLFASVFGNVSAENRHKQKGKKKVKSTKISESKGKEKTVTAVKIDSSKITKAKGELSGAKLKNVKEELDSIICNPNLKLKLLKKEAHASYYHSRFDGRRTASGKKFDNNGYSAAHKKLPFGTKLKVTNEANGKSVIVEVTDRGPFSKAREIDLSRRAFMEITSNKNSGVVMVTIEEVLDPK